MTDLRILNLAVAALEAVPELSKARGRILAEKANAALDAIGCPGLKMERVSEITSRSVPPLATEDARYRRSCEEASSAVAASLAQTRVAEAAECP